MKNCFTFFTVKGYTQAQLIKTSIRLNEYLTPRFLEDKDLISAKSAIQI